MSKLNYWTVFILILDKRIVIRESKLRTKNLNTPNFGHYLSISNTSIFKKIRKDIYNIVMQLFFY